MRGLFGTLARGERKDESRYGLVDEMWANFFGGHVTSKSGAAINWRSALTVSTVMACTRRIADGLATVPWKVYRKDNKRREEARGHPLYDLLATAPNAWTTSLEFRESMALHLALVGNAYVYLNRVRDRIVEMILLEPGRVSYRRNADYSMTYQLQGIDGTQETVSGDRIWHLRGPSWDTVGGLDIVAFAREAIGLALTTEESHSAFHRNGVRPSGILAVEGPLDQAQLVKLAAWVRRNFAGAAQAGRLMTVDRSAKFQPLQMSGVDSQHIETRKFQVERICEVMGVMPIMIGYSDKTAAYASSEQMFLAHLVHTVRPWHRRVEGSADLHLLTSEDRRQGYYTGFVDTEFLRAASKDRAEFNKIALGGGGNPGWLTPNEVRGHDELPPIDGGDNLYVGINTAPIGPDGRPIVPERLPGQTPAGA
jgi:HK97 family phage portal protein